MSESSPFCDSAPPPNIFMWEKMNFLAHENVEIPVNPAPRRVSFNIFMREKFIFKSLIPVLVVLRVIIIECLLEETWYNIKLGHFRRCFGANSVQNHRRSLPKGGKDAPWWDLHFIRQNISSTISIFRVNYEIAEKTQKWPRLPTLGSNISAHRVFPDIRFVAADAEYSLVPVVKVWTKSNDVRKQL